ncbi:hypothetical protein RCL_jg7821.t1 [Rhizophagus clarus]|uniref:Endonuclease/exonuclease/phosphatase domain-containing protein n=1 Tax=Rhizophagus clarus TaxID=94130 RepID=A0A8H3R5Q4_9GLOM|nr:hypothetical protein RCL_jg7821.t1 [Rhizophagus clarus]
MDESDYWADTYDDPDSWTDEDPQDFYYPNRSSVKPNFRNTRKGSTQKGGSMHMNDSERMQFLMQCNENAIEDIKNDLVKNNQTNTQSQNNKRQNISNLKRMLEMSNSDSTNNYNNDRILSEQINQQSKALSNVANLLFKLENKLDNLTNSTHSNSNNRDVLRGDASVNNVIQNTNNTNTLLNQSTGIRKKKKRKRTKLGINTNNASLPTVNTTPYYFNIGTINVTGLTDIKMQQLIEYMEKWDFYILGLTETSLNVKQAKFVIGTKYPKYDFFNTDHT